MNITFFYNDECRKCAELKPIMTEFSKHLGIKMIDTYEEDLITESYNVEWVPTLAIEDENGKHLFEGVDEIKDVLRKLTL